MRLVGPMAQRLRTRIGTLLRSHIDGALRDLEGRISSRLARVEESHSRGWGVYMGQARALAGHPVASFMYVDTNCLLVTPRIITGTYEAATTAMLRALLSPGMQVIEIGANQGFHTLSMATHVHPGGKVHAFEPNPEASRCLETNVAAHVLHEIVAIDHRAAADRDGVSQFRQLHGYSAGSHLVLMDNDYRDGFPGQAIEVETVDIGRFVRTQERAPDLIKVDAEGAEYQILRSLAPALEPAGTDVVVEIIPHLIDQVGGMEHFLELVEDLGYRYWALREERFAELSRDEVRGLGWEDVVLSTKDLTSLQLP